MYPAPLLARKIACSLTILLVCTTFAAADDVHWQPTGSHGFDWGTPQNWNPHLPGSGDNVFINLLNAPALNVNATIANLTLQGGVIDTLVAGSQNLTVTGTTTLALSGFPSASTPWQRCDLTSAASYPARNTTAWCSTAPAAAVSCSTAISISLW